MNVTETNGQVGGSLWPLALLIERHVEGAPDPSVGEHLHLAWVSPGEVKFTNNDRWTETRDGEYTERRMPPVVTTLAQYRQHAKDRGWSADAFG
jgi:hypothetical protein